MENRKNANALKPNFSGPLTAGCHQTNLIWIQHEP